MDATPKDYMGQAITEQTLFETWYHGRTVLIGDASHRMLANAAHQGAVNGMLDAVILSNLIHHLPAASPENLAEIFKEFQTDRYAQAKSHMHMNNKMNKFMSGQVTKKKKKCWGIFSLSSRTFFSRKGGLNKCWQSHLILQLANTTTTCFYTIDLDRDFDAQVGGSIHVQDLPTLL